MKTRAMMAYDLEQHHINMNRNLAFSVLYVLVGLLALIWWII